MKDMVDSGLARTNPDDGPNNFDNLFGIRSKVNGMTIDTSAALGQISVVLQSGEGGGVELGVGPMPGPSGTGGVLVGGGALYMSKKSSPEKIAATWELMKFLVRGDTQATFAAGTGYVPIAKSALDEQVLKDQWAKEPGYRVAYDQMLAGKDDQQTAGPVIGDYAGVRGRGARRRDQDAHRGHVSDAALQQAAEGRHRQDQGLQHPRRRLTRSRIGTQNSHGVRSACQFGGQRERIVTLALAPRPTVWASATRAPSTWRGPAVAAELARRARPPDRAPTRRAARPSTAARRTG